MENSKPENNENTLILSVNHPGKVYRVADFQNPHLKQIAERKGGIWALCEHEGKLYDGGDYGGVYDTISGECVAKREGRVTVLCSHEGKLYAGLAGKRNFEENVPGYVYDVTEKYEFDDFILVEIQNSITKETTTLSTSKLMDKFSQPSFSPLPSQEL